MKNNRGEITIQLVVTVIVLIIIGVICIFMMTGENGLFVLKGNEQNQETTNNSVNTNTQNTVNENGVLTVPTE